MNVIKNELIMEHLKPHQSLETIHKITSIIAKKERGAYLRFGDGDLNIMQGLSEQLNTYNINFCNKLKESIIQICDDVHLGEYKLHTRIARDGKKLNSLPQYVVRSISNGGLIKKNNTKKYDWNNIVQLNEDNILIGVKMWAELYRHKVGKKNDIGHWRSVLNSLREDYDNYSLSQLENRVKHSLELINKTTIDILGEGKILQIYQEKDSGREYGS